MRPAAARQVPPTPRVEYDQCLREFRSYRNIAERTAVDGRKFVLLSVFEQLTGPAQLVDRLRDCINRCMPNYGGPALMRRDLDGYSRVLFILVEIGLPDLFNEFRDHSITDDKLPLRLDQLQAEIEIHPEDFYHQFCREQMAWFPVFFRADMGSYMNDRIVPFYRKELIRPYRDDKQPSQNNASLWEVDVPEEVIEGGLVETLIDAGAAISRAPEAEPAGGARPAREDRRYRLALKQFPDAKKAAFRREIDAFKTLSKQDGMIRYIGWYQSYEGNTWFWNIILEYAEEDLYSTMRREAPPVSPEEIQSFWEAMLDVCRTLRAIHNVKIDGDDYYVWHGDIKPENILRVRDRFKLADPGEARIQRSTGDMSPQVNRVGGTMTYAPPEKAAFLSHKFPQPIRQNSDVWSLGGVLSNAATYVVLGTQGVLLYDRVRRQAIKQALNEGGDAFHDNNAVLSEVHEWHDYLRGASRRTDTFTSKILTIIDEYMLVDASKRYNAAQVTDALEKVLQDPCNINNAQHVPESIISILQEIDLDAETIQEMSIGVNTVSSDESGLRLDEGRLRFNVDTTNVLFKSKLDLLKQQILPTAQRTLHRNNTGQPNAGGISRRDTAVTGTARRRPLPSPLIATRAATNTSAPDEQTWEDMMAPYTAWNLMDELRGLDKGRKRGSLRSILPRKKHSSVKGRYQKHEDRLEDAFKGRDIVFIVDNGATMNRHWSEATFLLEALTWRALGYDDDGMELYFANDTGSCITESREQCVDDFVNLMKGAKPHAQGPLAHPTNIIPRLCSVIQDYVDKKCSPDQDPKPKTILILTDGVWQGMQEELAVDRQIMASLVLLRDLHNQPISQVSGGPADKKSIQPITIQFIRFGDNPVAKYRLDRLDNNLTSQGYEDVVDVEPSNGDVYKMFLGSLIKDMDAKLNAANTTESSLIVTPRSSTSELSFRARSSTLLSSGVESSRLSITSPPPPRSSRSSYSVPEPTPPPPGGVANGPVPPPATPPRHGYATEVSDVELGAGSVGGRTLSPTGFRLHYNEASTGLAGQMGPSSHPVSRSPPSRPPAAQRHPHSQPLPQQYHYHGHHQGHHQMSQQQQQQMHYSQRRPPPLPLGGQQQQHPHPDLRHDVMAGGSPSSRGMLLTPPNQCVGVPGGSYNGGSSPAERGQSQSPDPPPYGHNPPYQSVSSYGNQVSGSHIPFFRATSRYH